MNLTVHGRSRFLHELCAHAAALAEEECTVIRSAVTTNQRIWFDLQSSDKRYYEVLR